MRQLKHHEQKLLKKVDFLSWKSDAAGREVKVMRRYHVQERSVFSSSSPPILKNCAIVGKIIILIIRFVVK